MERIVSVLSAFILLLFSTKAFSRAMINADSLAKVYGNVINAKTQQPLEARLTFIIMPNGEDIAITNTEHSGTYNLTIGKNYKYTVEVEAPGFAKVKDVLTISGEQLNKNYALYPDTAELIRLDKLFFAQSEEKIPAESFSELDQLADMLQGRPTMKIQLEGHTDFRGDHRLNKRLSEKRVMAVKKYLINKGVDRERIKLKAFGGTHPLSRAETEEAKKLNRRVEVRILER